MKYGKQCCHLVGSILAPDLRTGLHSSTFLPVMFSSGKQWGYQSLFTARDLGKAAVEPVNECGLLLPDLLLGCENILYPPGMFKNHLTMAFTLTHVHMLFNFVDSLACLYAWF